MELLFAFFVSICLWYTHTHTLTLFGSGWIEWQDSGCQSTDTEPWNISAGRVWAQWLPHCVPRAPGSLKLALEDTAGWEEVGWIGSFLLLPSLQSEHLCFNLLCILGLSTGLLGMKGIIAVPNMQRPLFPLPWFHRKENQVSESWWLIPRHKMNWGWRYLGTGLPVSWFQTWYSCLQIGYISEC